MSIVNVKNALKAKLDALVDDEVLAGATTSDLKKDPLSADIPNFPHAFLAPPAIETEVLDNRTVIRTYTFGIMVLFNAENLESTTELEEKIEDFLNAIDNDPDLNGTALGGLLPVAEVPQPFQHNGKDLIMVMFYVKAKDVVSLSFA